jgi:hypothetical protein
MHAADVLQSVHMVCTRGGLREQGVVDDLSILACYLAAVVHDFEHKGVNNDYLVGGWQALQRWRMSSGVPAAGASAERCAGLCVLITMTAVWSCHAACCSDWPPACRI